VNIVGPWPGRTPSDVFKLNVFNAIDPAYGWFKISAIENKDYGTVMDTFHSAWLCKYPRRIIVTGDNGGEFKSVF
jgi:hypothetical protein